jgi:hypothetical protein
MTDRPGPRSAVGARLVALGASVAATLGLMGGMAAAADAGGQTAGSTSTAVDLQNPAAAPQLQATNAPPTTPSRPSAAPATTAITPPPPVTPQPQVAAPQPQPTTAPPTTSSRAS